MTEEKSVDTQILEALQNLTVMVKENTDKTEENQMISKNGHKHIEEVVRSMLKEQLPFDHMPQHDQLRTFLSHAPEPKEHSEDHSYTKSARERMSKLTESIISALGPILVTAIGIGLFTYYQTHLPQPAPQAPVTQPAQKG